MCQKWIPAYGYKKAVAEKEKDWLLEVPGNAADPNIDLFAQKREAKKERVAKNEYQRLRNVAASRKVKVPAVGLPPLEGTLHSNQVYIYFYKFYNFFFLYIILLLISIDLIICTVENGC